MIIRGVNSEELAFVVNLILNERIISGGGYTLNTIDDIVLRTTLNATTCDDAQVVLEGDVRSPASFGSSDLGVAIVGIDGMVTRQGDGDCFIRTICNGIAKKSAFNGDTRGNQTSISLDHYVPGSLPAHIYDAMITKIAASDPSKNSIFLASGDRNPDFFLNGVTGLQCIHQSSDWAGGGAGGITPITPRHFISCRHWYPNNGAVVNYRTLDNEVITMTIESVIPLDEEEDAYGHDLTVGKFTEDLPDSIGFLKVVPPDFSQFYAPSLRQGSNWNERYSRIPTILNHQFKKMFFWEIRYDALFELPEPYNGPVGVLNGTPPYPSTNPFYPWHSHPIVGDSGSAHCMIVNNEFVIFATVGGGSFHRSQTQTKINATIATLGGGDYELTLADFTEFTNFD